VERFAKVKRNRVFLQKKYGPFSSSSKKYQTSLQRPANKKTKCMLDQIFPLLQTLSLGITPLDHPFHRDVLLLHFPQREGVTPLH
jgi:hypothetical protein